ncbi:unnamed protein product, partial [Larinioides sclopetarius]
GTFTRFIQDVEKPARKNAPGTILDSTKSSRGKKKKMKICCSIEKSSNVDAVKDEMDNFNVPTYNCKIEKSRVS